MVKDKSRKRRRTAADLDAAAAYKNILKESGEKEDQDLITEDRIGQTHSKAEQKGDTTEAQPTPVDTSNSGKKNLRIIVLLDNANLETVKLSGKNGGYAILNCDEHQSILRKHGKDSNDARPDITHQCLLALLDSPLNKAGKLQLYIHTKKNVLIEVNPQIRIPRTSKRFLGLMVELLHKMKIRGTSGSKPLLKLIPNPFTAHLPVGTRKILCTYNTNNVVDIQDHAKAMAATRPEGVADDDPTSILYVVGAMAHGKVEAPYAEESICISEYPLSAATVCSRITFAYENLLGIL